MIYMRNRVETYCGIPTKDLLDLSLLTIKNSSQELVEKIMNDPLYEEALCPPNEVNNKKISNPTMELNSPNVLSLSNVLNHPNNDIDSSDEADQIDEVNNQEKPVIKTPEKKKTIPIPKQNIPIPKQTAKVIVDKSEFDQKSFFQLHQKVQESPQFLACLKNPIIAKELKNQYPELATYFDEIAKSKKKHKQKKSTVQSSDKVIAQISEPINQKNEQNLCTPQKTNSLQILNTPQISNDNHILNSPQIPTNKQQTMPLHFLNQEQNMVNHDQNSNSNVKLNDTNNQKSLIQTQETLPPTNTNTKTKVIRSVVTRKKVECKTNEKESSNTSKISNKTKEILNDNISLLFVNEKTENELPNQNKKLDEIKTTRNQTSESPKKSVHKPKSHKESNTLLNFLDNDHISKNKSPEKMTKEKEELVTKNNNE